MLRKDKLESKQVIFHKADAQPANFSLKNYNLHSEHNPSVSNVFNQKHNTKWCLTVDGLCSISRTINER